MNLYEVENEKSYKIVKCPNVGMLQSLGIFEDAKIHKKNNYKMGGPVLILIENREVAIGKDFAIKIEVEEVV